MSRDLLLRPHRGRKRHSLRATILAVVALLLLLAVVAGAAYVVLLRPASDHVGAGKPVRVDIATGEPTAEIAEQLKARGVIENAAMFRIHARLSDSDSKLKAGKYDLKTGMTDEQVLQVLASGPTVRYVTVTIPEGFTLEQIAARYERDAHIPAASFYGLANDPSRFAMNYPFLSGTRTLEGYLFPKTYQFEQGVTAEQAIDAMLAQFKREIADVDLSYATKKNLTLSDVVIIGSLVEREAKVAKDRPLVASVIYNRLHLRMRLEIDATVQYALGTQHRRLLYSDLKIDSPYNTYLRDGLPPGPIASPGLAALKAAARPADTRYVYYVLTGKDGSHTFAATSTEFLRAKAQAKRGLR